VVLPGGNLAAEQGVIQPGRDYQPGHAAQPGQPVLVVVLVQPRVPESGGGPPADGQVVELGQAEVHGPVDQHVEAQAPAGAELEHADPALAAVVEHHGPHAACRSEVAGDPFEDRTPWPGPSTGHAHGRHDITHPPLTSIVWPVTNAASG
jgi:hypothetical protein